MKPSTPFNRVPRDQLAPHHQERWDRSLELHDDTTFVEVLGNAPEVYDWYVSDFYEKLYNSGRVDRQIVELIRFRFANVHGCAACNRGDRVASLEAGLTEEELDAIDDYENGPFSEHKKAALALADVMVLTNPLGTVSPGLYARLKCSFSDAELVELGVIMAVLVGMAKFTFAYDLLEKLEACPFIPPERN